MNKNIQQLAQIAAKKQRCILGLMSGTSLDGLDMALCQINNSGLDTTVEVTHFETIPYDDDFITEVQSVFSRKTVNLQKLCLLNEWIAKQHAAIINQSLQRWGIAPQSIDLIASHGQTVYHAPFSLHGLSKFGNGTLQIGDGDHIAMGTGIITVSDFRQKHLAAGGEGAPLAAYGDYLLFSQSESDVVLLNIGGISNFTFLPKNKSGKMFSTDIGPGNALMDRFMQENYPGKRYDDNATLARQGEVCEPFLKALFQHSFLQKPLPKSTGPELFNAAYITQALERIAIPRPSDADIMATLNCFTGLTIERALREALHDKPFKLYVSGGGIHNPLLMEYLQKHVKNASFHSTEEKAIRPDAKEAVLFATLANEAVAGDFSTIPGGVNNFPPVSMGKISFPF